MHGELALTGDVMLVERARLYLVLSVAVLILVGMPLVNLAVNVGSIRSTPQIVIQHLFLNFACNCLVVALVAKSASRTQLHLPRLLLVAIGVHGAFAVLILASRMYFSRPILFSSFLTSIVLGFMISWVKMNWRMPRVGFVGNFGSNKVEYYLPPYCVCVTDLEQGLGEFDLILVDFEQTLQLNWINQLSKAMLEGKRIRHIGEYTEDIRGRVSIDHFNAEKLNNIASNQYLKIKRLSDIALVLIFLPIIIPICLIGMLAVCVSMGRPVFFIQERVGLGMKNFKMFKLRTMRSPTGGQFSNATLRADPRVTPVGHILRRFRIDELPQIWNVLVGDMSIIGPRPEQPKLSTDYCIDMPPFACRSLVRPGITGWAQVSSGYAANLEETRLKLAYDLFYVKNISFYLDAKIFFQTVWTLIGGAGVR